MRSAESSESEHELEAIINEEIAKLEPTNSTENRHKRQLSPPRSKAISKSPSKQKRQNPDSDRVKSDYEKYLDKLVFGDKSTLLQNFKQAAGESGENPDTTKRKRKPVWQDADDEQYQIGDVLQEDKRRKGSLQHLDKEKKYSELLKSQFHRTQSAPKWADLDRREREADSDEDDVLLSKSVGHLVRTTSISLPANNLNFKRMKDLNRSTYAEGGITSIQFHPTSTVALVSGYSGIASIYSIDGLKNEKLHNVQFKGFPIKCARLAPDGLEAILGSHKNHFYSYDLIMGEANRIFLPRVMTQLSKFEISGCGKYLAAAGRFGEIHLLDSQSKELIHTFKQENCCTALQFSADSMKLLGHSTGSDVTVFDLRQEKVEHIFTDDGCVAGKSLVLSANNRLLATGSNEGVVNVYNYLDVMQSRNPQPQKVIYNLKTSISDIKFNHSAEMLAICSETVPGAVRLIHFPSGTVFANFPGNLANIGCIKTMEFSPGSGYLALGNAFKEVPLYRLKHFGNY